MAEVRYTAFSGFDDEDGFIEESGELIASEDNESFHYDPVITTPAYHIEQGEKALEKLKFIVSEGGWKKALTVKNTTVYTKNGIGDNSEKTPIYMCQHIIEKFSPQSIFAVIGMRKLWDPWYEEGNLIENLNDSTSLTYMVMQGVAGTKIRDLSLVEKIQCTQDGTIYFAATSVEKVPQVVDRIRAHLYLNGWIIKPISYNPIRTRVTYVLQAKINGWVPTVVAKKYLLKRPLVVHTIDQYLQKNGPPPMVISNSTSPPDSGRHSSESSASFHSPRNFNSTEMTDQQRSRFLSDIAFKDTDESRIRMSLDSPSMQNNRRETIPNLNNGNNLNNRSFRRVIRKKASLDSQEIQYNKSQSFKKELHRKTSLDSMQTNRRNISFYLNRNNNLGTHREIQINTSLDPPSVQNNDYDLSSQSSQVTLEAHEQRLLSDLPTSPKQNQFPLSLNQETHIQNQPTSPVQSKPTIPSLPSPPLSSPPLSSLISPSPHSPRLPIKHQYTDDVNAAVAVFKDNIKTFEGWDLYSENKGVKVYIKDIAGRSTPMIRGDYTLLGSFTADDFLSVIKNLDLRKFWDDRYDDGENIKFFDNDNILSRVSLKGTFPISGRDFALRGTIERDPETSTIYFVTTSITDPAIPEIRKYVRGHVHFTGWQITPEFDANGNTRALDIIYVVDTDIKLESVPQSILKSISTGTPMVIQKIDEMMQKIGFPPYIMNSSSLIISENLNPKSFQYSLSYVAKNSDFTDIRFSKKMYPNGFDMSVIPNGAKFELLPDNQEIIRIIHPLEDSTEEIQIKITKYTDGFKMTYDEKNRIPLAQRKISPKPIVSTENTSNTTDYSSKRSAQQILQSEIALRNQNYRHSRHSRNFSQPINHVSNGTLDANNYNEQDSFSSLRQQRHSRNLSQPSDLNSTLIANEIIDFKKDDRYNKDSLVSNNQEHSKRLSRSIDPNATLVADEIVDKVHKNEQDRTSKRKSKRLSFADSPSIINPKAFYDHKEENIISETELKPAKNENKNSEKDEKDEKGEKDEKDEKYEKDEKDEYEYVDDEYDELKEYEDIIKTFNEGPIEHHQEFDFDNLIFVTDNVKFNIYQITIMFIGMVISYYSGRMSCYYI